MSDVYLIAGPNGSGKTTVAKKILPNFLGVIEYVNADEMPPDSHLLILSRLLSKQDG
jgi:predicted ABC-type ATPase